MNNVNFWDLIGMLICFATWMFFIYDSKKHSSRSFAFNVFEAAAKYSFIACLLRCLFISTSLTGATELSVAVILIKLSADFIGYIVSRYVFK